MLHVVRMKTKQVRPWEIPVAEAVRRVEKMIDACVKYSRGYITFDQLWYRCRGDRNNYASHKIEDKRLAYLLFQLNMDFMCWRGERDDMIQQSALQVVEWVGSQNKKTAS